MAAQRYTDPNYRNPLADAIRETLSPFIEAYEKGGREALVAEFVKRHPDRMPDEKTFEYYEQLASRRARSKGRMVC